LLLAGAPAATARAQAAPTAEERLTRQIESQQADLAEQEARLRDLEKQLAALVARQKEAEKPLAQRDPLPAAPPPPPAAAPPDVASLLPDFLRGLTLSGYVQGQYESHQDSEDQLRQGGDPLNQDRFLLRRARFKVEKQWQYAAALLELDASTVRGPSLGVQHAEASLVYRGDRPLSAPPILEATFGLFDVPFGAELTESPKTRWFLERGLASRSLFPGEPDLGFRLRAALGWFRASVALTNGEPLGERTGYPLRDPNAAKDLIARVGAELDPHRRIHVSAGASVLNGRGFHAGTDVTKGAVQWKDQNEDGLIESFELTSVPATTGLPAQSFRRWAVGADLRVRLDTPIGVTTLGLEATLASNLDRGLFLADPVLTGIDSRELGVVVGATQEILGYGVLGFRFDAYDPSGDAQDLHGGKLLPVSQTVRTFSPLVGLAWPDRARLLFQYDVIRNNLGRDARGVPESLKMNTWTLRLQVNL
jgi:hypothetical protein